jgi:hypothetical protein
MKIRSRTAVLTGIAMLIATGTWTAFSTASGSSVAAGQHTFLSVDPLSVFVKDVQVVRVINQTVFTVDPGSVMDAEATCPKDSTKGNTLNTWTVIGGGYHMFGVDGAAVASATAAYPALEAPEAYKVVITNPKLAANAVTFAVEATCMDVQSGPLGS